MYKLQFLPRYPTQSAVVTDRQTDRDDMRLHVVSLFVCLCVYGVEVCFSHSWNTSKIISRPNRLRSLLTTQTWAIWCSGNTPKIRVGLGAHKSCNISETVQDRTKVTYYYGLTTNWKSHTRFRLVPNSMTLDDPEPLKRHSCRNRKVLRNPPEKFQWR